MAMAIAMMTTTADGDGHGVCDDRKSPSRNKARIIRTMRATKARSYTTVCRHHGSSLPASRGHRDRAPQLTKITHQLICELVSHHRREEDVGIALGGSLITESQALQEQATGQEHAGSHAA